MLTIVTITAIIAHRAVRRSGKRMAGLNWLMLSSPENASQAAANPTKILCKDISRAGDSDSTACNQCIEDRLESEQTITTKLTTKCGHRHGESHSGAFSDTDNVENGEAEQTQARHHDDMGINGVEHAADVVKSGNCRNCRREKITCSDQHTAETTPHGAKGLGGDGDDAAALGIAPGNFDIFQSTAGIKPRVVRRTKKGVLSPALA